MTDTQPESFEAFKNSFSYGSRSDMNFKFLAGLSEEEAADFFQDLLSKLGAVFDGGDLTMIVDHVVDAQVQAYSKAGQWSYDDAPFTRMSKPLSEARLALLTSTGHFPAGEDPAPFGVAGMTQDEAVRRIGDFLKAEPALTPIPVDIASDDLQVRHGGYDIRGVQADRNVAFPIDRLREYAAEGRIGELLPTAYSFVGAAAQMRILNHAGPAWVEMLQAQDVEAALLVPV